MMEGENMERSGGKWKEKRKTEKVGKIFGR